MQNEYSLLRRRPERRRARRVRAQRPRRSSPTSRSRAACSPASTSATRRRRRALASRACPTERQQQAFSDKNFDRVEALDAWAGEHGHTLLELAFAWLLARPAVASVIAGATKPEQVAANVAAAGWTLTDDDLAEIDALLEQAKG